MRRSSQRGQVIVEFALAATFTFFLILAVIDFGRALFANDLVAQVARAGTRFAIVNATPCTVNRTNCELAIVNFIKSKMGGGDAAQLVPAPAIVWQQVSNADCFTPGCSVTITVSYAFKFVAIPFASRTLRSTSQMVISQ